MEINIYCIRPHTNHTLGLRYAFLNTHEWSFYVFDPVVMLPCFVLVIHWHSAKYLPYLGFRLPKHAR
jgi:hypothetical protein